MITAALQYAKAGIPVFPCAPDTKAPLTPRGFHNATTDEAQIRGWWSKWPEAWIGMPTGGDTVIDVDAKHADPDLAERFEEVCRELGFDPSILPKQTTPNGNGAHFFFRSKSEIRNRKLATGVDGKSTIIETRGKGGYVCISPSQGYVIDRGNLTDIPTLTDEQVGILMDAAKSFDSRPEKSFSEPVRSPWARVDSGLSPGDDYNQRGDVLDLLRAHGWHAISKHRLRRPGKDRGVSATWDIVPGKFFCFTSNAFPFEANTSYSPFAVYALLEHDGSFAEAARALRLEGFGGEAVEDPMAKANADAVLSNWEAKQRDIEERLERLESSKPSPTKTSSQASKPVPEVLLSPPGMLGDLAKWIEANAYMPQPWLSVGAALASMSVLCGRQYSYNGQRSNLFIIASAPSSSGKENGRRCIKDLFAKAGCMDLLGHEDVSSDKAILTVVKERGRVLFPWDEIGHIFLANKQAKDAAYLQKIIPTLMTLYSSAGATYMGRAYANSEDNLDPIHDPHVCIYGTTTPTMLKESFSTDDAKTGWMGRVLFFQSFDEPPPPEDFRKIEPPDYLVQFVRNVYRYKVESGNLSGLLSDRLPESVRELACTKQAKEVLRALQLDLYAKKKDEESESIKGLIGKAYEMALRVCICVAVGCRPDKPEITKPIAEWVSELIRYLLGECLAMADRNTGTDLDDRCVRVLTEIKRAGDVGIRRQHLLKAVRGITSKELTGITAELVDRGEISADMVSPHKGGGRPTQVFVFLGSN